MLVATFRLSPALFALEHTLDEHPDVVIHAERIAAHSTEWVMPCLWVAADDVDAFTATVQADPSVDRIINIDHFDEESFYHLEWIDAVKDQVDMIIDREGSILNAETIDGEWQLRIRFVTRDQFTDFRDYLATQETGFELLDIYEPDTSREAGVTGTITPKQREALIAAAEHGYYRVPRESTLADVGDYLDVSSQALSGRLRRGTENLIRNTFQLEN
jgi:hypothetical protein